MAHFGMAQDLPECRIVSERVEPWVPSHRGESEVTFLDGAGEEGQCGGRVAIMRELPGNNVRTFGIAEAREESPHRGESFGAMPFQQHPQRLVEDRKSTRLNSSHSQISYAVFCL